MHGAAAPPGDADRPTPGDGGQTEARPTDRLTDRPADGRPASPGAYEQIRDHRDMATAVVPAPSADGMLAGHGVERLRGVFNTEARVAVVGSSGNLLFRGHGAEIDAHDIVIRMKYALQAIELASVRARRDRGDRGDRGDRRTRDCLPNPVRIAERAAAPALQRSNATWVASPPSGWAGQKASTTPSATAWPVRMKSRCSRRWAGGTRTLVLPFRRIGRLP